MIKVRLGIDAPKEVTVHRREVYEAIQNQNPCDPVLPRQTRRSEQDSSLPRIRARVETGPCESAGRVEALLEMGKRHRDVGRPEVDFINRTNSRIHGPLSGQPRTVTRFRVVHDHVAVDELAQPAACGKSRLDGRG